MVEHHLLQLEGVVDSVDLVVLHGQRDEPIILLNTLHNMSEVILELIVRQINSGEVLVASDDLFSDHDS